VVRESNERNKENEMRVKVTTTTQYGDTSDGYNALLHTDGDNTEIVKALIAEGYEADSEEESDEAGYTTSINIFSGNLPFTNKTEFIKELRQRVKEVA
jgi:hypothetical protein